MTTVFGHVKCLTLAAAVSAFAVVSSTAVLAAPKKPGNFPERPITIIFCYGKAGGSAQSIEAIQGPASEIMGVNINAISKPGGGALNCLPDFLQAPADGYTILHHVDALPAKYAEGATDLNPAKELSPLMIMNVAPSGLFIKGDDKRFMTDGKPDFDKVVAYAKQGEGKLTVSNINIAMELVTMAAIEKHFGFKAKQVLFPKPAQRYGAVIGGKMDVLMEQPGDVSKHVEAGKLAPVLSVWPERFKISPDTKATGKDYGMNFKPLLRFRGMYVKRETPAEITNYLREVFYEAYKSPEHQKFLKRKSLDIVDSFRTGPQMQEVVEETIKTYGRIFKEMGMPVRKDL